MFHVVKKSDAPRGAIADVAFEGEPYDAGISFFEGDLLHGMGPALHQHPYPEICLVRAGQAAITVDGQEVVACAGNIVIIGPKSPHSFTAIGSERLEAVCVHAASRFVIEWLGD
ncbi:cupin domain-containing protein [Roseomonas sp. HF4]|uniref:cupin domain-containing protein n=1 Tax=Roseomonas sp. HF4 TaxID=2562313 RepID=UPI0010C0D0EB|nr:cupin domain-containing protein [Roseomonas sp. HF4]